MRRLALVAFLSISSATLGQSQAQSQATVTVIANCANAKTGAVRFVYAGTTCLPTEIYAQWNVQGPTGATGLAGAIGPMGPTGATGPAGASGPQGTPGATGSAGQTGPTGPQGAAGTPGAPGQTGASGPTGPVGPTGAPGGQVWSSNLTTFTSPLSVEIGTPTGSGLLYPGYFTYLNQVAIKVPTACVADHFDVSVVGAPPDSAFAVTLGVRAGLDLSSYTPTLTCVAFVPHSGKAASCSSPGNTNLSAGDFIHLSVQDFNNGSLAPGTQVLTSFVCN